MLRALASIAITAALAAVVGASPPPQWLHYDDGTAYQPIYRQNKDDGWAVKFEPEAAGYIQRIRLYVGNPPGYTSWDGFQLEIWDWYDSSFPEAPGKRVWGPEAFTYNLANPHGWVTYTEVNYEWKSTQPFLLLAKQRDGYPNCDSIYCDASRTTPNPNWSYFIHKWYPFVVLNGDFLFRVYYGASHPGVAPTSLGRIRALYR